MASPVYIGFWARFVAFLVNSIIALVIMAPLSALLYEKVVISDYDLTDREQFLDLIAAMSGQGSIETVIIGTLFILLWVFRNAEPGKMLFRAVIVDARSLQSASAWQYVARYIGYYVSLLPFGLGFIWIAFDARKQGWHDKIAGTVVIKEIPETEPSD